MRSNLREVGRLDFRHQVHTTLGVEHRPWSFPLMGGEPPKMSSEA